MDCRSGSEEVIEIELAMANTLGIESYSRAQRPDSPLER
jgi:hypothetical protein